MERPDRELLIRYQGETVDFQEWEPPASVLWGEGTGRSPTSEGPKATDGLASSHLDREQRKLLAELESSVEKRAKAKSAAGKGKPFATSCTASLLPPNRPAWWRYSRPKVGDSPCGPLPESWGCHGWPPENMPKQSVPPPTCSAPRSGPRPRPWSRHRSPQANRGDNFAFHLNGQNRWTTTNLGQRRCQFRGLQVRSC